MFLRVSREHRQNPMLIDYEVINDYGIADDISMVSV